MRHAQTFPPNFQLTSAQLAEFCKKWQVAEFALFGSVWRDDFSPQSDIDVLVTFEPEAKQSLFDLVHMRHELSQMLGRPVDILTKKSVEQNHNWLRKREILESAQVIYGS
ncbi:MAG: nucleotidyltransferase family protein [Anaerolineae bacterium]|nr:nucleotidyltransferase family protein [Anaerolineae bacterium]